LFVGLQGFDLNALGVSECFRGAFFGDVLRSVGRSAEEVRSSWTATQGPDKDGFNCWLGFSY